MSDKKNQFSCRVITTDFLFNLLKKNFNKFFSNLDCTGLFNRQNNLLPLNLIKLLYLSILLHKNY